MINLARMQLVSRDRAELEASLSDSRLCQKWQRGVSCFPISALVPRLLATWASVSPFPQTAVPHALGSAGWTQMKLEGEVCRAGAAPSRTQRWASPHRFPAAAPPPTALPTAPPFLFFTPSSPGAASQQKESLGSNDEDGCVIDSAPLPSALLVEN